MGIEPTYLAWKASVLPLNYTRMRAIDGTRTRDPNLGKVVLHQLSHYRIFCFTLGNLLNFQCPEPESNQRHEDFQSSALPTELSGHLPRLKFQLPTTLVYYQTLSEMSTTFFNFFRSYRAGDLPVFRLSPIVNIDFPLPLYSFWSDKLPYRSARLHPGILPLPY